MMSKFRLQAALCAVGLVVAAPNAFGAQGSGCMPTTGTVSGLTMAQDINAGIAALISSNSGNSAPATDCSAAAVKGQFWLDISVTPNVLKQYDGTSWTVLGALDATNHLWSPPVGGGTASVAAATTTDICAAPAALQTITGTTTITSFGSSCAAPGIRKTLIFGSATPITYNASTLIIPGQLSYTTSAGDVADAVYLGSGNWRIINITKIDGSSVTNPAVPLGTILHGDYADPPAKTVYGYGQAIARASYPAYFAAVTRTQSGTLTAGNNTITSVGNTDGLGAGMPIEGTGVQASTVILSLTSSTIVMSKTATANGVQSISVIKPGYGAGGDSTTVGVKDCRGYVMAGRVNPLGSMAARLTAAYFGADGTSANQAGGSESTTLTALQIPSITSTNASQSISVNTAVNGSGLVRPLYGGNGTFASANAVGGASFVVPAVSLGGDWSAISNISGTNSISVTSNNTGGLGHRTVQPTAIAECVVAVLP